MISSSENDVVINQQLTQTKNNGQIECVDTHFKYFLDDAKIRGVSSETIRAYRCHLKPLIGYLNERDIDIKSVTSRNLKDFVRCCIDRNLSVATINDYIRVFKQFFKWALAENIITENPAESISKLKEPRKPKPILSPDEIAKVISICAAKTFHGLRNRAIIQLMWDCGLRRNEVLTAKLDNLDLKGKSLEITGKGNKTATMPMSRKTVKSLRGWIKVRGKIESPYLFVSLNGTPLDKHYITHMINKLGVKVGIKVYPHLIRHSVITWLAEQGMEPFTLQAFARHESMSTTMIYVQKARIAKQLPKAHRRYSPGNKVV